MWVRDMKDADLDTDFVFAGLQGLQSVHRDQDPNASGWQPSLHDQYMDPQ